MENENNQAQNQRAASHNTPDKTEQLPQSRPRSLRQWQRARPGFCTPARIAKPPAMAPDLASPLMPRAVGSKKPSLAQDSDWPQSHAANYFTQGEQAMWRAVILQALTDAACESHKYEARLEREKARRWLLTAGTDFCTVCDYAGFEPERVKRHVRKALAGGCQWRIAPKEGSLAFQRR